MLRHLFICFVLSWPLLSNAQQQTVGLFQNDSASFNGYTLFAPSANNTTYLIDNCGAIINTWESSYRPGQSAYLLEDGTLIRTARIGSPFSSGGTGGRIEMYSWDGSLTWGYNYSSDTYHQHHDIAVLPNGNVLILAWELRTPAEAIQAGRDPDRVPASGVWSERIVEVKPTGPMSGEVVWQWHLWDHLVQDLDSFSNNFGIVEDHPELIDLNFPYNSISSDWIHANSIDYNPELDQIMINSRDFEEFWIIDHATTTEEAAGHTGGRYGKGGDILYRWGNPRAYKRGTGADQVFSLQHDAHWIPTGVPGEGQIMVFNNGVLRPQGNYSSIDVIEPDVNPDGSYNLGLDGTFGPDSLTWSYGDADSNRFYSPRLSGSQRLPNGNTLICNGTAGTFFEIDPKGNEVWKYNNPVGVSGPVAQGQVPPARDVFRAYRYAPDYPAFDNRELIPGEQVENDPWPADCVIWQDTITSTDLSISVGEALLLYPNPASDVYYIETTLKGKLYYQLVNSCGQIVQRSQLQPGEPISCDDLVGGLYFIRIFTPRPHEQITLKLIIQ